jgi:hypothetical protein
MTERPSIGDSNTRLAARVEARDFNPSTESQTAMGRGHLPGVETLAARCPMASECAAVPCRITHEHFGAGGPRSRLGQRFVVRRRLVRIFYGIAPRTARYANGRDDKSADAESRHEQGTLVLRARGRAPQRRCATRALPYRQGDFLQEPLHRTRVAPFAPSNCIARNPAPVTESPATGDGSRRSVPRENALLRRTMVLVLRSFCAGSYRFVVSSAYWT